MVINGCEVVVVVTGLTLDCVAIVCGLLVGTVAFLLINGRTGVSAILFVG